MCHSPHSELNDATMQQQRPHSALHTGRSCTRHEVKLYRGESYDRGAHKGGKYQQDPQVGSQPCSPRHPQPQEQGLASGRRLISIVRGCPFHLHPAAGAKHSQIFCRRPSMLVDILATRWISSLSLKQFSSTSTSWPEWAPFASLLPPLPEPLPRSFPPPGPPSS